MKLGTLLSPAETLPYRLREAIQTHFPGKDVADLDIRYYESVEDVGYEYFTEKVLPTCNHNRSVQYLAPFVSYIRLGEALVLDQKDTVLVYDIDRDDHCTETGPFWLLTSKSA